MHDAVASFNTTMTSLQAQADAIYQWYDNAIANAGCVPRGELPPQFVQNGGVKSTDNVANAKAIVDADAAAEGLTPIESAARRAVLKAAEKQAAKAAGKAVEKHHLLPKAAEFANKFKKAGLDVEKGSKRGQA